MENISDINQRKAGVAILLLDSGDFRAKKVRRSRKGHYVMTKGLIHQEDTAVLYVYAPNKSAAKHVNQKLIELKGGLAQSTIIIGDFTCPPIP